MSQEKRLQFWFPEVAQLYAMVSKYLYSYLDLIRSHSFLGESKHKRDQWYRREILCRGDGLTNLFIDKLFPSLDSYLNFERIVALLGLT